MIRRKIALVLSVLFIISLFSACRGSEKKESKLINSQGDCFAGYDGEIKCENPLMSPFAHYSLSEAAAILMEINKCSSDAAQNAIAKGGYTVETTLNKGITEKISAASENFPAVLEGKPIAAAVSDLDGALLALYSNSEETDYANKPTYAGSSIKPLSVYAQIIENGQANWSSVQLDTPVKKVVYNTELADWPQNATGIYSEKETTVAESLKVSLNTVAVKWLQILGVTESMDFLENKLGFNLSKERELAENYGEEEILANIALGYLRGGVTVAEMAGYYQIFAKEGKYTPLYSVKSITDSSGQIIYEAEPQEKQIIAPETAFIMNKLLQKVSEPGGTGEKAADCGVTIAGKTGTTTGLDNWFVGVTPEFSCAVWHGDEENNYNPKNFAPEVFSEIIKNITTDPEKAFPGCDNVIQRVYCAESGKLLSDGCSQMEVGWFSPGNIPDKCTAH